MEGFNLEYNFRDNSLPQYVVRNEESTFDYKNQVLSVGDILIHSGHSYLLLGEMILGAMSEKVWYAKDIVSGVAVTIKKIKPTALADVQNSINVFQALESPLINTAQYIGGMEDGVVICTHAEGQTLDYEYSEISVRDKVLLTARLIREKFIPLWADEVVKGVALRDIKMKNTTIEGEHFDLDFLARIWELNDYLRRCDRDESNPILVGSLTTISPEVLSGTIYHTTSELFSGAAMFANFLTERDPINIGSGQVREFAEYRVNHGYSKARLGQVYSYLNHFKGIGDTVIGLHDFFTTVLVPQPELRPQTTEECLSLLNRGYNLLTV